MRIILKIISVCLFGVLISSSAYSQQRSIRTTIRGEAQLPRMLGNRAFTKGFSGVFNGGASINFGGKHFNTGAFYRFTQYQVFPKVNTDAHPILSIHTAGIRFAYDKLTETGKGMWSPFIEPGFSFLKYTRVQCIHKQPRLTKTNVISLNIGSTYYIMMDEWTGVGFTLGYNMLDHVYRPENICMDEWGLTYTPDDKKGSLRNIFFGFSVYFDLAFKAETSE